MAVRGALLDPTCEGVLTVAGVSLNTVAYAVSHLIELYGAQVDYRGTEIHAPYAQGSIVYPRWRNATRHSLPMIISGRVTTAGVAAANPMSQLATHITTLTPTVSPPDPWVSGESTVAASLLLPNGSTLTARVVPLGLVMGDVISAIARCTLELLIPDGRFA